MKSRILTAAVAAGIIVALAAPALANDLVRNGGFEDGDFSGWNLTGDMTYVGLNCCGTDGNYGMFIGSDIILSQTLSTVSGQQYDIRFTLNQWGGPDNYFYADFGGTNLWSLVDAGNFDATFVGSAIATSTSTTISFSFHNPPGWWNIDEISVTGVRGTAVPEPAAWTLMVGGFGLVGGALRGRTRRTVSFG